MQGVVALTSQQGTGRLRLKKIESILLLILRLLYIEKRKELSLLMPLEIIRNDITKISVDAIVNAAILP